MLAHPGRGLGRRLVGHAGVELIETGPGPGALAARRPAAHLAVTQLAEVRPAGLAHPARRLVGFARGKRLQLVVRLPDPLALAAVDPAGDRADPAAGGRRRCRADRADLRRSRAPASRAGLPPVSSLSFLSSSFLAPFASTTLMAASPAAAGAPGSLDSTDWLTRGRRCRGLRGLGRCGGESPPRSLLSGARAAAATASVSDCMRSCVRLLRVAVRVQPGTVQATSLSSSARQHAARGRRRGSSAAVGGWRTPRAEPGRSRSRSRCSRARHSGAASRRAWRASSCRGRTSRRRETPGAASDLPSVRAALPPNWSQVRLQPATRQGIVFAPRRSASVNPPSDMTSPIWCTRGTSMARGSEAGSSLGHRAFDCSALQSRRGHPVPSAGPTPERRKAASMARPRWLVVEPRASAAYQAFPAFPTSAPLLSCDPHADNDRGHLARRETGRVRSPLDRRRPPAGQGLQRPAPGGAPQGIPSRQGSAPGAGEAVPPAGRGRRGPRPGRAVARTGHPGEADPAGRPARGSTGWSSRRASRSSSRPGSRCGPRSSPRTTPAFPLERRPPKVTRRAARRGAGRVPKQLTKYAPVEGRDVAQPSDVLLVEVHGKVGEHKIKKNSVGDRPR